MLVETAASDVVTVLMVMGSEAELNGCATDVGSVDVVVSGAGSGCIGVRGGWGAGGGWGAIGGREGAYTKIIIIIIQ